MPAPISVIIPTLNAQAALEGSLPDLFLGIQAGLIAELIISDGGSNDATLTIAEDIGGLVVSGTASRGGQIQRGVAAAKGKWCLILHADTHLGAGWCDAVQAYLENGQGIGYFDLGFQARGIGPRWVAAWANMRSRVFKLPYGDQGLLARRDDIIALGYPDQPLMEDVEFAKRAKPDLRPIGYRIETSFAKYRSAGWLRRGARNLILLGRYKLGADPATLAREYTRR